ncbi:MAG: Na+/H+ antiporter subunit E [Chloroflexi bacterium]|nr:Na+/H+ antiporter subunit E [Chloroflexota bacterium]
MNTIAKRIVLALPLSIGWTIYTAQPTPGNFLLGYIFSVVVLTATGLKGDSVNLKNAVLQLYNLIAYVLFLSKEVFVSGVQVARIIISPSLPIDPGITRVKTQDESKSALISAVSAHGITITPGELVVDFEERGDETVLMIVHSLTISESGKRLDQDQSLRLKRIKGILGHD